MLKQPFLACLRSIGFHTLMNNVSVPLKWGQALIESINSIRLARGASLSTVDLVRRT